MFANAEQARHERLWSPALRVCLEGLEGGGVGRGSEVVCVRERE